MRLKSVLAVPLIISLGVLACGGGAGKTPGPVLAGARWKLVLDSRSGAVSAFFSRPDTTAAWTSLLPGVDRIHAGGPAAGVVVYDLASGRTFRPGDADLRLEKIAAGEKTLELSQSFDLDSERVSLKVTYSLNTGPELYWKAALAGSGEGNRSLRVAFELPLREGVKLWFQSRPDLVTAGPGAEGLSFWYVRAPEGYAALDAPFSRHDLTLPLAAWLDRAADLGVTLAHPLDARIPSAGFLTLRRLDSTLALQSITALVGLHGKRTLEVSGYLVSHRADYRPGLKWMLDKWPEYFLPDPGIYSHKGIYSIGGPATGARGPSGRYNYEGYREYGAFFFEMHAHFPWYGLYFPDHSDSDTWPDLRKIEHGRAGEDKLSLNLINQRLRSLQDAGFHTFYYFAINDGYPPEAERRWPDAVAYWPDRVSLSGWNGGGIAYRNMNADTLYSFGKALRRQADGIIGQVGPLAGIFFDTVHHNDLDFAHSDSLTLVYLNGRSVPAYSINFCYDFFLDYLSSKLHQRGEHLFINGPAAIRNAKGVDAVMLEGLGQSDWEYEFENRRFLSCLARPLIWLFPGRPWLRREILLQRCLIYGAFPSAPASARGDVPAGNVRAAADKRLWLPYLPLFEALRGRVLCFEPDPLELPEGYRGEVFTLPDGRYAVALINEGLSVLDPENTGQPAISLRLEKRIGQVRLVTPLDHAGRQLTPKYRANGELELEVPDFRGAALIFLQPA